MVQTSVTKCDKRDSWCQFYAKIFYVIYERSLRRHSSHILLVVIRCHETSASHSGIAEDSNLLGCYAMLTAEYLPTFRSIVLPSLSVIIMKELY